MRLTASQPMFVNNIIEEQLKIWRTIPTGPLDVAVYISHFGSSESNEVRPGRR